MTTTEIPADTPAIQMSPRQPLPAGYRWGAHISAPGREGYWIIDTCKGRGRGSFIAWMREDYERISISAINEEIIAAREGE